MYGWMHVHGPQPNYDQTKHACPPHSLGMPAHLEAAARAQVGRVEIGHGYGGGGV